MATRNFRHTRLESQLALDALRMALADRQPSAGLIHHSDRGSQYASQEYQALLARHGIVSSMSRKGNCWDNSVAESFFATLKIELVYQTQWSTRDQARSAIFEYLELFYNRRRLHSALGYLSPTSSNYAIMNPRLLNPSVHAIGAGLLLPAGTCYGSH